jgi:hypothetical protein
MDRRYVIKLVASAPLAIAGASLIGGCSTDEEITSNLADTSAVDEPAYKSFGYYQGLGPNESRSSSRSDGTYHQMPCITLRDVARGATKEYQFWHGHGGGSHKFTVTAENFAELREGKIVEIFTNIIDGHRHALRISPQESCEADCG